MEAKGMRRAEGTYTFYKDDRERIKGRSMLPTETLRYIEALEAIAKASLEYWKNTGRHNDLQVSHGNDLYEALAVVNFMDEDL